MPFTKLASADKKAILVCARHAIQYGLTYNKPPLLNLDDFSEILQQPGCSFITLTESNQLRGCIGSLEAQHPLIQDVANNAYAAAFSDPRFPPVNSIEEPVIHISVSVLSAPEALEFGNERELLEQLRPNVDGVILHNENKRATFLPSVWEQLPEPELFLGALKKKAGLAKDFWSQDLKCSRYTVVKID